MAVCLAARAASGQLTDVPDELAFDEPPGKSSQGSLIEASFTQDVPDVSPPSMPTPPAGEPVFTQTQPNWKPDEPGWIGGDEEPIAEPRRRRWFGGGRFQSNGRYRNIGGPLGLESWLTRPYSIGLAGGGFFAGDPIQGQVNGTPGFLGALRFGWDVEYFWGVETRLAFSTFGLTDPLGIQSFGRAHAFIWDLDYLYYPLGDTKVRPYVSLGGGFIDYKFNNALGWQVHMTPFELPIGIGVKYRHNNIWVFRADLTDNLTFASGNQMSMMNSISLTGGVEVRYGAGPKRSYWPWNSSKAYQ